MPVAQVALPETSLAMAARGCGVLVGVSGDGRAVTFPAAQAPEPPPPWWRSGNQSSSSALPAPSTHTPGDRLHASGTRSKPAIYTDEDGSVAYSQVRRPASAPQKRQPPPPPPPGSPSGEEPRRPPPVGSGAVAAANARGGGSRAAPVDQPALRPKWVPAGKSRPWPASEGAASSVLSAAHGHLSKGAPARPREASRSETGRADGRQSEVCLLRSELHRVELERLSAHKHLAEELAWSHSLLEAAKERHRAQVGEMEEMRQQLEHARALLQSAEQRQPPQGLMGELHALQGAHSHGEGMPPPPPPPPHEQPAAEVAAVRAEASAEVRNAASKVQAARNEAAAAAAERDALRTQLEATMGRLRVMEEEQGRAVGTAVRSGEGGARASDEQDARRAVSRLQQDLDEARRAEAAQRREREEAHAQLAAAQLAAAAATETDGLVEALRTEVAAARADALAARQERTAMAEKALSENSAVREQLQQALSARDKLQADVASLQAALRQRDVEKGQLQQATLTLDGGSARSLGGDDIRAVSTDPVGTGTGPVGTVVSDRF